MDERYSYLPANCIVKPPGPQCIVVNQVIGECDAQKVVDIHLVVPRSKPAIEQVVDVFVKRLCITDVEIITNKVIVRGSFEIKALYVACLPSQPVHAVEARHVRFTAAADIPGAHCGDDADAHAFVEYVDYSGCHHHHHHHHKYRLRDRLPKWKKQYPYHHKDDHHDDYHDDCDDDCHDDCHDTCDDDCKQKPKHKHKPKAKCKPDYHSDCCCREIDATVVICVRIKVMRDRPVTLYAYGNIGGQLPYKPKG